ncbi:MAG: saccharopine dehydrogenase NADP-binding domain-containing protein [Glaciecola sp.]|jgi:short subunit dehydrogenase-like uncharacterized protein|nr:saccharopine dehydrogenase NADP-binding domain-containing protein [Glaciecola sp.]MDG2098095.1 saccharopine dehydrogenase NADP-binding domain-containing protein [Glaciecola sp.]
MTYPLNNDKPFDIVIYGATGFTGQLVAEYMHAQYANTDVKWAIAGRSENKLNLIKSQLGLTETLPIIVADSQDEAAIRHLVQQTKVVITTVGPYQLYGDTLVSLCAELGTDYVDLCGEPSWMRQKIDALHHQAEASGARIVFSCGFDSIPFDLGVFFLQEHIQQHTGHTFSRVKCRVRAMNGKFSGGTAASLKATMVAAANDPKIMEYLANPFALANGFTGPEQPAGNQSYFDEALNSWSAPFIMATINTKNIHRSNALLDHLYGKDFVYDEMILTGPGEEGEKIANFVANDKSLAGKDAPKPGEGPSKEERENGNYDIMFIAEENDKQFVASVGGHLDPGYGSTSKMLTESAMCLAFDDLATLGGIYTPAPAMGEALIKRLINNAGLYFTIEK